MMADERTRADLSATDHAYARLLYGSGIAVVTIERALRVDARVVKTLARREGWRRATPRRPDAVVGINVPILVRCAECGGTHGEALHRAPRPCPHCGRERLVLL